MSQLPTTAPTLKSMLADPTSRMSTVRAFLEAMSFDDRLAACMTLGRKDQRRLFQLAAQSEPCTFEDFVPAGTPATVEVIHEGKNTLPVFTRFEKRFCAASDGSARVFGYNEGFTRKFIGPGYFVGHMTDAPPSEPHWTERGAVVVNYWMVPEQSDIVVEGWPKVSPNSKGLQMFVYKGTRDYMRKVASDVTIGEAFRGEKSLDNFFTLVRRPLV